MPESRSEVLRVFVDYSEGRLPREQFLEWIALANWQGAQMVPMELLPLVHLAVGKIAEYGRDHRSEESLKEELVNAVRPFAIRVVASVIHDSSYTASSFGITHFFGRVA
jgi:hypothetical protein